MFFNMFLYAKNARLARYFLFLGVFHK